MPNVYRTSRGTTIDLNQLKLQNETTIAVGNANQNARGDIVKGRQIVKTREQVMREFYNLTGNNIVGNGRQKVNEATPDAILDNVDNVDTTNATGFSPYGTLTQNPDPNATVVATTTDAGLAEALLRSQQIAEKLSKNRKKI